MNLYRKFRNLAWRASMKGLPRGAHITRYSMFRQLQSVGATLSEKEGRILSVSHSENLAELMGLQATELVSANYPDHDFLALSFADESFDFVLSDQVLEHVEGSPEQAVAESHRVLRPGGVAIHTTCFINPVHGAPADFWRFTPQALALLHREWSEILEVGGWGNFDVWNLEKDGMRYVGVPHATWHPLHKLAVRNDPLWPIVTWVVARK